MIARRRMLEIAAGSAAVFSLGGAARAATLPPTPRQTAGPFYPLSIPADSDNDLVRVAGHNDIAKGTLTYVGGRVLDLNDQPLSGMRVQIWQCDTSGRYHYVQDDRADTPLDDNFQGYGRTITDEAGSYRFRTIRPVPSRPHPPHPFRGIQPWVGAIYDPDVHRR
jgi:protocatechuate 3,4-dioxygenase beta subunit